MYRRYLGRTFPHIHYDIRLHVIVRASPSGCLVGSGSALIRRSSSLVRSCSVLIGSGSSYVRSCSVLIGCDSSLIDSRSSYDVSRGYRRADVCRSISGEYRLRNR